MSSFLVWLSGADPELLSAHRVDRARYVGMGTAILTTGTMACVAMWFALRTVLNVPAGNAIPFAAGWALMIMALDRWLVVSIRRRETWKVGRYLIAASPRLAMAVLFGILVSTPLTLRVFEPEIQYHLTLDQQQESLAYEQSTGRSQLVRQIALDESNVAALNIGIKGGGQAVDVAADPTYQNDEKQLAADEGKQQFYYDQWQCQLYGIQEPGGPKCIPGNGFLAGASGNAYSAATKQVAADEIKIADREQYLAQLSAHGQDAKRATDERELANAEQTLTRDEAALVQSDANSASSIKANTGLLARLNALNQAADSDLVLRIFQILLFLFFLFIDCLPVLVKIIHNLGPEDEYETALEKTKDDRQKVSAANSASRTQTAIAKAEATSQIKLDALRRRVARKTRGDSRPRRRARRWPRKIWARWSWPLGAAATTDGTQEIFLQEFRPATTSGSRNGHAAGANPTGGTPTP
jgi:Domain of unknown function (DUF4407)